MISQFLKYIHNTLQSKQTAINLTLSLCKSFLYSLDNSTQQNGKLFKFSYVIWIDLVV